MIWELSELFCYLDFSSGVWLWMKWTEIWKVADNSWTGQQGEEKNSDQKMGQIKREGSNIPGVFEAPGLLATSPFRPRSLRSALCVPGTRQEHQERPDQIVCNHLLSFLEASGPKVLNSLFIFTLMVLSSASPSSSRFPPVPFFPSVSHFSFLLSFLLSAMLSNSPFSFPPFFLSSLAFIFAQPLSASSSFSPARPLNPPPHHRDYKSLGGWSTGPPSTLIVCMEPTFWMELCLDPVCRMLREACNPPTPHPPTPNMHRYKFRQVLFSA